MDALSKLTAAPRAFTWKGERYELSPLSLTELAMAKDFVRKFIMDEAKRCAAVMTDAGAPAEHIAELWREASVAFKDPLNSSFMNDAVPVLEFMRLSLRKQHPKIAAADISAMFDDPDVLAEVMADVQSLNSVEANVKNLPPTPTTPT